MTDDELPELCPRCDATGVRVLTRSPVPGAWTMFSCTTCLYSWRSTEPAQATTASTYPPEFKINPADIDSMPVVPAVPERKG
ncbi:MULTISPECIES: non-oxidative hydroxyarylic acid decarboxylases subunit D [Actinopolyspora]|uniref:Phenolic acid decarboxylase subunit D n=1 Tax=Actinopolyspora saharensis TaxID=995062 RepID=A0A1H0YKW2_9ACTN|nr:non-oxidative hydroxyarylic acid decarboxylases subunit D [Actinopolyspora saharensis]SDQ15827.1 hypothetical protein SAMN04489718_0523 [Actinopolyspora saharensis]